MAIHPRNQAYKDLVLQAPYEICIERARYYTESYRRTEGEHPALRAAKAFEHTVRSMSIYILDDEQVVGNRSSKLVAAVLPIERGDINKVLELEIDALLNRAKQPFHIEPAERQELFTDIIPYWHGKTVRDGKKKLWKKNGLYIRPALNPLSLVRRWHSLDIGRINRAAANPEGFSLAKVPAYLDTLLYNNPALVTNIFDMQGHLILGHNNILQEGFGGVKKRAQAQLTVAQERNDQEGIAFLEAVIIVCDAIKTFAARFADEAERLAGATKDPGRRKTLCEIAKRCRRVPFEPPRDFKEAIQALWLTEVGAFLAYGMTGIFAIGRFDQYLLPFYKRDKAKGLIKPAEATALLEELLIKLSTNLLLLPHIGKNTGNELGADSCAPTIGGLTPDGRDGTNELTYLILDAFTNVKSMGNSFSIRFSDKTPAKFWRQALATFRTTSGAALFNDDVVIQALERSGVSERDARDYGVIGCVEPTSSGNTFGCTSGNDLSLPAALEMTLLNGYLRIMGKTIGPRTGDPRQFKDFAEFMAAFKKQVSFLIDFVATAVRCKDQVYQDQYPNPYVSATLTGCVENARDMTSGGAVYSYSSIGGRGMGTVTDSLAAIKTYVYDTGEISMDRLIALLESNFADDPAFQAKLIYRAPKYGNDEDPADLIAAEVTSHFCTEVLRHKTIHGGVFRPGFFSYGMHVVDGLFLGATPNGRTTGEPISNSFSPSNGSEKKGPTAMLRSLAKIDQTQIANGCALNVKFLPALFEGEERLGKMVSLVQTYFALGGMEMQPNVVSNATLRAAQQHPEQYRDLVVRVSGYSALFTDLGKPLQDEIISRTELGTL